MIKALKELFKDISLPQVCAGALAAVGSVVTTVSSQIYKKAIADSADAIKQTVGVEDRSDEKADEKTDDAVENVSTVGENASTADVNAYDTSNRQVSELQAGVNDPSQTLRAGSGITTHDINAAAARQTTVRGSHFGYDVAGAGVDANVGAAGAGANSRATTTPLDGKSGLFAKVDEASAIASLDQDPATLITDAGTTPYRRRNDARLGGGATSGSSASSARSAWTGDGTRPSTWSQRAPEVDKTVAYPYAAGGTRSTHSNAQRSPQPSPLPSSPYASRGGAGSAAKRRGPSRAQVLGIVIPLIAGIVAVVICAVVVNFGTSGEGIGYRPQAQNATVSVQEQTGTATDASDVDGNAAMLASDQIDAGQTTTTVETTDQTAQDASQQNATATDGSAGTTATDQSTTGQTGTDATAGTGTTASDGSTATAGTATGTDAAAGTTGTGTATDAATDATGATGSTGTATDTTTGGASDATTGDATAGTATGTDASAGTTAGTTTTTATDAATDASTAGTTTTTGTDAAA